MNKPLVVQPVSDVERGNRLLKPTTAKNAVEHLINLRIESCSEFLSPVVECQNHPFIDAINAAFSSHYPLVLSPDMFWQVIAQGFANHIKENSETYRSKFVEHSDKKTIQVRRDDFVKGAMENSWEEVFGEFSEKIKDSIGEDNHRNIVADFSTTGVIERAANEVILMDSMTPYFEYEFTTRCGIPEVTLEGQLDDWKLLRSQTERLGNTYDLNWWTDQLLPTLDSIVATASGSDETELWKNIYKAENRSGGRHLTGWIIKFFPYLQNRRGELYVNHSIDKRFDSIEGPPHIRSSELPNPISKVPFNWIYKSTQYPMEFLAGFTSFTQNPEDLSVRPKIGWAVRDARENQPLREQCVI